MLPGYTLEAIVRRLEERHEPGELCVVGLMFARYDVSLIQDTITESYRYWHLSAGRAFDVFWAGYGEHLPEGDESPDRRLLEFAGNDSRLYFDLPAYIDCKRAVNNKKWLVNDRFTLLLLNCKGGRLSFGKNIRIDLEKGCGQHRTEVRDVMDFLIEVCRREHDLDGVSRRLTRKALKDAAKNRFTVEEILKIMEKLAG